MQPNLHPLAASGDACALAERLAALGPEAPARLAAVDARGFTPLACALEADASLAVIQGLLAAGNDPNAGCTDAIGRSRCLLSLAVRTAAPESVAALLDAGADLHYREDGFGAVLDAVFERASPRGDRLLPMLALLSGRGARLDDISSYGESALRVLSRRGRFDAVGLLLRAGADESQLAWSGLHRAVALGRLEEVTEALEWGADSEAREWWERTPFLLACSAGEIDKAECLRRGGAILRARGRCGQTALMHAIEARRYAMLEYLLGLGLPLEEVDDFGQSALVVAAQHDDERAVARHLAAGAEPDAVVRRPPLPGMAGLPDPSLPPGLADALAMTEPALNHTSSGAVARRLIDAGADIGRLTTEARRGLLGLPGDPDARLLTVDADTFAAQRTRRFGRANPERMNLPYWLDMIRCGLDAWSAAQRYGTETGRGDEPGWCAQRFGQSISFLPDGRIVQVGGEHEDYYDPDFCIYNDVFVHHPDGRIEILGYPEDVFPPTDFHSATLVGERLVLIGSLG